MQHITTSKLEHTSNISKKEKFLSSYNETQDKNLDFRNQYKSEEKFCGFNDGFLSY